MCQQVYLFFQPKKKIVCGYITTEIYGFGSKVGQIGSKWDSQTLLKSDL